MKRPTVLYETTDCTPFAVILAICNSATLSSQPVEPASQSGLMITFDKFEQHGSYKLLNFVIENKSDSTYYVVTYHKSAGDIISPLYIFSEKVNGKWQNLFIGWCGTGAETFDIKPGETLHFSTREPETSSQYVKAGIYTSTDISTPYTQTVFSNEVKIH
jgi:hypothetical protein